MGRKCSQCGNTGHNLRTCTFNNINTTQTLRLFGVQLNLTSSSSSSPSSFIALNDRHSAGCSPSSSSCSSSSCNSSSASFAITEERKNTDNLGNEYESDELTGNGSIQQERKKGVAWTEEEHKMFLIGLEKLGKGDWKGISRDFVTTRTSTQVASHAQKFFLRRQISLNKTKRRPSLFDIETCQAPIQNTSSEGNNYCGLTLNTTKSTTCVGDDFRLMKLDSFGLENPNFGPDLDLKLNCNISSFNASN